MRSEGQAEALKFGEEIFLVIDWGTGRREKEGAGIVWARYVATRSSSTFLRAFIFWFMWVAQLLYGRGMPRPIAAVTFSAHSIMANYWVAACRDRTSPLPLGNSTFCRAFIFRFMRVAQLLYGRGMPRPIAVVTFSARSIMAYYWVAACRDRTSPSPPSKSTFLRAFIFWFMRVAQLLYGRGMPRPIAKVSSSAHSIMANYWVAACRDRTSPLPLGNSTFCRAFIFRFMRVAQLLYGRGMPRPIAKVSSSAHSIMPNQ